MEIQIATLTAMVANTGFARFKEVRQPGEFMPTLGKQPQIKLRRNTKKEQQAKAAQIKAAFNTFWGAE